jgi:hypothetical protein
MSLCDRVEEAWRELPRVQRDRRARIAAQTRARVQSRVIDDVMEQRVAAADARRAARKRR